MKCLRCLVRVPSLVQALGILSLSKLLPHKHLSESSLAPPHCYFHPRSPTRPFHISLLLSGSLPLWSFPASPIASRSPTGFLQIMSPAALPSTESPRRLHRHNRLRPFCSASALGPQLVALFSAPALKADSTRLGSPCAAPAPLHPPACLPSVPLSRAPTLRPWSRVTTLSHAFHSQRGSLARATLRDLGIKTSPGLVSPEAEARALVPPPHLPAGLGGLGVETMTARGTPSRFLTSVLHNGLGRYVQQLQRLSFSLSRDAPSSRGAR